MSVRDSLPQVAQRRYDIELKRLTKSLGDEEGRALVESMATRWAKAGLTTQKTPVD